MMPKWLAIGIALCAVSAPAVGLAQQAGPSNGDAGASTAPETRILSARVDAMRRALPIRLPTSPELMLLGTPAPEGWAATEAIVSGANTLALTQDGSDNEARLLQAGTNNVMNLRQIGDANDATLVQHGHRLQLEIEQTGGAIVAVTQVNR